MIDNIDKARSFLDRLKQNPVMKGHNPLQMEEELIKFLRINEKKLYPTLSSPAFFPGYTPDQIYKLLVSILFSMTEERIRDDFENWIKGEIHPGFLHIFAPRIDYSSVQSGYRRLIDRILKSHISRGVMAGSYTSLKSGLIDRYVLEGLEKGKYINFELKKIQKLKMKNEEILNLVKTTLLLRPAVMLISVGNKTASESLQGPGLLSPVYAQKAKSVLQGIVPEFPPELVSGIVNSWVSFQDSNMIEASSRLASIFSFRGRAYREGVKVDRGAETSDKSWFGVSRKNYKFMGFDPDMISELYTISSENGW